jgi:hypothetical protein
MADYTTVLRDHVVLKCRSADRIFLQAYVPKLQTVGQVCTFLRWQRKFPIPSSAAFGKIGEAYVKAVYRFAEEHGIPVVLFEKDQNKEEVAKPYIEALVRGGKEGVAVIGVAQEKAVAWRSWKAKGQEKSAHPHMEWGRQMVFVNHFYFYLWDRDWGAAFWKTNAYAPYPIWIWLNGHEWAKRQLEKAGVSYQALDNGFRACADPLLLQTVCDQLNSDAVESFFQRWFRRLPSPFTQADVKAGYAYEMAFRQFEVSETCVFDQPQSGRMWFEGVIRDHLDIGRPDQVALIFDRRVSRSTPGTFRSRVLTRGVDPTLCCYYKSSRLKQYFKEGKALRTETVICDTRDFGIGRRVCAKNWNALRAVGESANRRLCDAESAAALPPPDVVTFEQVTRPSLTSDGLYAPGLRFGDRRAMAVLASLVAFCHVAAGLTNAQLVAQVRALGETSYTKRQATYDLRRLKRKALIEKQPKSRRYQLTPLGRSVAVLFTKTYCRVLTPGLTALDVTLPAEIIRRTPLGTAWNKFEQALASYTKKALTAA